MGDPAAAAREDADRAARRSGVRIEQVRELDRLDEARRIVDEIWQPPPTEPPVARGILRALTKIGNYCALAYDGDEAVGVCVGFVGLRPERTLFSHIAGVTAKAAGRHVGLALKLDQRAWALGNGLASIAWTYDPLVRRNAFFNASKLGALPTEYLVDFYGDMDDGINLGQPTDRLTVTWSLLDASPGEPVIPADARLVLDEVDGRPVTADADGAAVRLVRVPADIEALRVDDPELAGRWRYAVRDVLGGLMGDGWMVTGVSRDGCYLLRRPAILAG